MTDTPPTSAAGRASTSASFDDLDGEATLAAMRGSGRGTLMERMGIELTEASVERTCGSMPVEGNTQPYGLLHGGASIVLAETLGSIASMLSAGPGRFAVGVDINATHHRSARSGRVHGVATPAHLGRTSACYEVVITDDEGRRICTSRITCALRDGTPPR